MVISTNSIGEMYVQLESNPLIDQLEEMIRFYGGAEALALAIEREWYGYEYGKERDEGPVVLSDHANEIKQRHQFYYRTKPTARKFIRVRKMHIQKRGRSGDY